MANSNFIVQNGLTVGPATIFAGNGDVITSGNISVTGSGSFGGLSSNQIYQGQSNVNVANGTVTIGINSAVGNVATFTATGLTVSNLTVTGSETVNNIEYNTTVNANNVYATTIGNVGAAHIGATGRFDTSVTTATLNAATIGNASAALTGGTLNISGGGSVGTLVATNFSSGNVRLTGNTLQQTNATGQFLVSATVAPTVDQVLITNAGFPVITAGTSALQVAFVGGNAAVEASAIRADMTPGGTSGSTWNAFRVAATSAALTGVSMNGVKCDTKTAGTGTSNGLYIGTGWDSIINYNGNIIINGTGIVSGINVGGTVATANVSMYESVTALTTNQTFYPTFSNTSSTGNTVTGVNSSFTYNPGTGNLVAGQHVCTVATGTPPLYVASTTKVVNLNAELVDGYHADTAGTVNTIAVRDAAANIASTGFVGTHYGAAGITSGTITGTTTYNAGTVTTTGATVNGTLVATTVNAGTIGNASATLTGGQGSVSGALSAGTFVATNISSGNIQSSGAHIPTANATINLGSTTAYWNNLYAAAITTNGITVGASGGIMPAANVSVNIGSASTWFNTFYGISTQAKYADLAENYQADRLYSTGFVLMFGGTEEVTLADAETNRVAGIVSTNPAHLMNGGLIGPNVIPLALTGRVPCRIIGPVKKGDMMVSAGWGYAKSSANPQIGQVIGKALEDFPMEQKGIIEVVVGRL